MDITYFGHSAFHLKGKTGTVLMDPYNNDFGLSLPNVSADVITTSHQHGDHNATSKVKGTARRKEPFVIAFPGEYEVGGISVFGVSSFHDDEAGAKRGPNIIFTVFIDEVTVCHLGDLGHELNSETLEEIGSVDVLLCPVGGHFTIDPKMAVKIIHQLEPSYIIPMHYRLPQHSAESFGEVKPVDAFLAEYGMSPKPQPKLSVEKGKFPEETELVVLEAQI